MEPNDQDTPINANNNPRYIGFLEYSYIPSVTNTEGLSNVILVVPFCSNFPDPLKDIVTPNKNKKMPGILNGKYIIL
jgi:hypothetical protein